jgi:hypothetical protein
MLLRRSVALGLGLFVLSAPAAGSAGVLEDVIGFPFKLLLGSSIDKAKADIDSSIGSALDQVDTKLTNHEDRISDLAKELLDRGDRILDARILQVTTGLDTSVDRALGQLQGTGDELIDRLTGNASSLIKEVQASVLTDLNRLDELVKERSADLDKMLEKRTNQINQALQDRITQIDDVARSRLGDVNAIATKQRLELESMLVRVAVMIGSVVFLVYVLQRLWKRYLDLVDNRKLTERGPRRAAALVTRLAPALAGPLLVAACALVLFGSLYRWLPAGAAQQLEREVATHHALLSGSVLHVDPPRARFEASVLSHLDSQNTARYDGLAAKAALIRDVIAVPTLLASDAGVEQFAQRLSRIERELGAEPDPDSLTLHALLLWKTGETRRAEHEAASLAARALNLSPRGFALLPLARAYVQTFLNQPYFEPELGEGRDAMGVDELSDALALSSPEPTDSPFAGITRLAELMRTLQAASSASYAKMAESNAIAAWARGPGKSTPGAKNVGDDALAARTAAAKQVVEAWRKFDDDLQRSELVKGRLLLNVFGLNDAPLSRALWFSGHPTEASPKAKALLEMKVAERVKAAPARIAWARRYAQLLGGTAGTLLELEEARQFQVWERFALELEDALVAREQAERSHQDEAVSRWRAAVAAAALGLYVERDGARVAYAKVLAGDLETAPAGAKPAAGKKRPESNGKARPPIGPTPDELVELLQARGQRLI